MEVRNCYGTAPGNGAGAVRVASVSSTHACSQGWDPGSGRWDPTFVSVELLFNCCRHSRDPTYTRSSTSALVMSQPQGRSATSKIFTFASAGVLGWSTSASTVLLQADYVRRSEPPVATVPGADVWRWRSSSGKVSCCQNWSPSSSQIILGLRMLMIYPVIYRE